MNKRLKDLTLAYKAYEEAEDNWEHKQEIAIDHFDGHPLGLDPIWCEPGCRELTNAQIDAYMDESDEGNRIRWVARYLDPAHVFED